MDALTFRPMWLNKPKSAPPKLEQQQPLAEETSTDVNQAEEIECNWEAVLREEEENESFEEEIRLEKAKWNSTKRKERKVATHQRSASDDATSSSSDSEISKPPKSRRTFPGREIVLTVELWAYVLQYLSLAELADIKAVSREWKEAISEITKARKQRELDQESLQSKTSAISTDTPPPQVQYNISIFVPPPTSSPQNPASSLFITASHETVSPIPLLAQHISLIKHGEEWVIVDEKGKELLHTKFGLLRSGLVSNSGLKSVKQMMDSCATTHQLLRPQTKAIVGV